MLDRLAAHLGADRALGTVTGDELGAALEELWGAAAATWNARRAAAASWLAWCTRNGYPAPALPAAAERRPEHPDATRALERAAIERLLTRRDVPLREKTLWRMLYETAARASEVLALDVTDLDPPARRAAIISKGGATEHVYWASGTAHLLPRLLRGRTRGPVFLTERRPARPAAPRRRTCARTPASRDSATTVSHGSCSTATPAPAPANPGGTCTNCATPPPPTSARPTSACN